VQSSTRVANIFFSNGERIGPFLVQSKPYRDLLEKIQRLEQQVNSQAVRIVFNRQDQQIGNSARSSVRVGPFQSDTVVLINASGQSSYQGPTANAGIRVVLEVDGGRVASGYSFEALSSSINFSATTSHAFVLPQGQSRTVISYIEPGHQMLRDTTLKSNLIAFSVGSVGK
jgi:hypothetical protein